MKQFLTFLFALWVLGCTAQVTDFKKRHSFAKSYFGLDANSYFNLENSLFINDQNQFESLERSDFITPAINFGATHFWGHADFFVSIATSSIKFNTDKVDNSIGFRAITGMRIFPVPLKNNLIRPYLSYKFAPIRFNQNNIFGEDYRKTEVKSMFGGGIAYQSPKIYAYIGYEFIPDTERSIHVSRTQTANTSFPKSFINIGVNYPIEFTNGAYSRPIARLDSILHHKNILGWFLGVGPSSAFPTINSNYIKDLHPYLDDRSMPNIFPEITAGYHFSKHEFIISANFRPIRQERNSFSFNQTLNRNSFGVETYKFLFDYHGFAPFIGAGFSYEDIILKEIDRGLILHNQKYNMTTPVIVLGWDIRPSKRADIWLLRTNLRYAPILDLEKDNKKISLQHLEFNFIQAVIYPQRIKKYKQLRG